MKRLHIIILILSFIAAPAIHAQKKKNKGGGNKKGDINININVDQGKGDKNKGNDEGHNGKFKGDHNNDGHRDNGWGSSHNKGRHRYGNNDIIWFFGPGDIYNSKGKNKKQRIVIYDNVVVRLGTNIGFMFGLLGDIRINLDNKKVKLGPERYKKIKIEIDLLDQELKIIEIKKQKIKLRLAKLNKEKD